MDRTANFYSRPTYVARSGAGFPVYSGSRRQRDGSILGALKNFFLPLGKNLLKTGARQAIGLAANVAGDVIRGRNVKTSFIEHGKQHAKNFGRQALAEGIKSVKNQIGQSTTSRKRKQRSKSAPKRPKKKRRTAKTLF